MNDFETALIWLLGAENAAKDDGMVTGVLDLSYMGVFTVWMNLIGEYLAVWREVIF